MNIKFTHQDYLDKKCSHREYYSQFVTEYIKSIVLSRFGIEKLLNSKDEHLNDIPLHSWDSLAVSYKPVFAIDDTNTGIKYWSLCGGVCILKEAAQQIIEKYK